MAVYAEAVYSNIDLYSCILHNRIAKYSSFTNSTAFHAILAEVRFLPAVNLRYSLPYKLLVFCPVYAPSLDLQMLAIPTLYITLSLYPYPYARTSACGTWHIKCCEALNVLALCPDLAETVGGT